MDNIKLFYYNEETEELNLYTMMFVKVTELNTIFTDIDGVKYAIRYYNDKAKVAFATLKGPTCG